MVAKRQAIAHLADDFPQFERSGAPGGEPAETCFDIPGLVRFLTDELYDRGEHERIYAVFDQIERFMVDGTPEVRSVIGLVFLETLYSALASKSYASDAFCRFMGQQTRRMWVELDALWRASIGLDLEDRSILEGEVLIWRIVHQNLS